MELIISFIKLDNALFKMLFTVPILGIAVLLGTLGPMIIKAARHR